MDDFNSYVDSLPNRSHQKAISFSENDALSSTLHAKALRLSYYYGSLSQVLGFTEDAELVEIEVQEIIEAFPNHTDILYFAHKKG